MAQPLNRRTLLARGAATIATLSFLSVGAAHGQAPAFAAAPTPDEVFRDPDIPVLGNPDGDVTIVEFFDYQCPYCKMSHPVLTDAVETDGNVRLVMKDWPIFGNSSLYASRLMLGSAGTPDYEAGLSAVMKTQARLTKQEVDAALVEAGLDPAALLERYGKRRESVEALIDRNSKQALAFRLSGTPAFVIGQRVYGGALDGNGFAQAIADARSEGAPR
ncbi:DsbA family protein [Aurantimonas coralicida]|uniref:DsbA family protein n=1 Tax=Aurantimonas coralicida TaxID=182270 RepID=UPI001E570149|nr:DsbA family protein [Aurantimonas coralicida]MCD1645091.1 DsbA family protein [Aurantimonas coralicida]MCW7546154.1 DsbA family protein [Aurantimonas litoralis]